MTKFTVGMEVLIHPRIRANPYTFGTVAAVSPSGRIVTLKSGRKYTADGCEYGRGGDWEYEHIEPLTDEVRARIADEQARLAEKQRLKQLFAQITYNIQDLSGDDLQRVADLIAELRAAQSAR